MFLLAVAEDGQLSRIANWATLSEAEKEVSGTSGMRADEQQPRWIDSDSMGDLLCRLYGAVYVLVIASVWRSSKRRWTLKGVAQSADPRVTRTQGLSPAASPSSSMQLLLKQHACEVCELEELFHCPQRRCTDHVGLALLAQTDCMWCGPAAEPDVAAACLGTLFLVAHFSPFNLPTNLPLYGNLALIHPLLLV